MIEMQASAVSNCMNFCRSLGPKAREMMRTGDMVTTRQRLSPEEVDALYEEAKTYLDSDLQISEIAEKVGMNYRTLFRRLKADGFDEKRNLRTFSDAELNKALQLRTGGMAWIKIARQFRCDPATIRRELEKKGMI